MNLIPSKGVLAGVCAGIAYQLGCSVWLVRFLFVIFGHTLTFVYLFLWLLTPKGPAPSDFDEKCD